MKKFFFIFVLLTYDLADIRQGGHTERELYARRSVAISILLI